MPSGSCWCGSIKYEYTREPAVVALCHCLSCQKISGGIGTSNIGVPHHNFTITSGNPKRYSQKHESDMNLTIYFCETCGTVIYKQATGEMFTNLSLVQTGTLDGREKAELSKPAVELYVKERMSWLSPVSGAVERQGFV